MGAVGYRLYSVKTASSSSTAPPSTKKSPEEYRKYLVTRLNDALKLDPQQLNQVQKIYDDQFDAFFQLQKKYDAQIAPLTAPIHQQAAKERDQIHEQSVARIKALLRPDQEALYDKWNADRAAERARKQQEHKDHPEGKGHPDGKGRPPF